MTKTPSYFSSSALKRGTRDHAYSNSRGNGKQLSGETVDSNQSKKTKKETYRKRLLLTRTPLVRQASYRGWKINGRNYGTPTSRAKWANITPTYGASTGSIHTRDTRQRCNGRHSLFASTKEPRCPAATRQSRTYKTRNKRPTQVVAPPKSRAYG